jgi:hypothetical protein
MVWVRDWEMRVERMLINCSEGVVRSNKVDFLRYDWDKIGIRFK